MPGIDIVRIYEILDRLHEKLTRLEGHQQGVMMALTATSCSSLTTKFPAAQQQVERKNLEKKDWLLQMGLKRLTGVEDAGSASFSSTSVKASSSNRDFVLLERLISRTFLGKYLREELEIDISFIRAIHFSRNDKSNRNLFYFIICT